jgi:murein DD-endopeptidase MepM/ murein hydrolase activator NlpD
MMRNLLILAVLVFAAFVLFNNYSPEVQNPEQSIAEKTIIAPFRYAALIAREPEAKIQIPIRRVKAGQIADTFGAPRDGERLHQGQDIFAPRGTPVYSATEGYVWRVGENRLGGITVMVLGAGGRVYYYAHLDGHAPELKVGDEVTTETILGFVGNTGNAKGTPPHLHFSIYTTGGAINPLPLFE